jgi:hypothetical protein
MSRLGNAAHALAWKEWRQLRPIRWLGVLVASGLTVALLVYAASGGDPLELLGTAPSNWTRIDQAMGGTLLTIVLLLWPTLAALSAVRIFARGREPQDDDFLLDKPLSRGTSWAAGVIVALSSWALAALAGLAVWLVATTLVGQRSATAWLTDDIVRYTVVVTGLAFACALAAAAFRLSAFPAFLLALGVAAGLTIAVSPLPNLFYVETVYGCPLQGWLWAIFIVSGASASWFAEVRGEPAGRRRLLRAATMLMSVVLAGTLLMMAGISPAARKRVLQTGAASLVRAPMVDRTAIRTPGGVALISTPSGVEDDEVSVSILPGPRFATVWSPDGERLANWSYAGLFGLVRPSSRLEIFTREGRRLRADAEAPELLLYRSVAWCGERIVAIGKSGQEESLVSIDPEEMTYEWLRVPRPNSKWRAVVGRGDRCWLAEQLPPDGAERPARGRARAGLYPLTATGAADEPVLVDAPISLDPDHLLSPSGTYWLGDRKPNSRGPFTVREVAGDRRWNVPVGGERKLTLEPTWVGDDLLVWFTRSEPTSTEAPEHRLHTWSPGSDPEASRLPLERAPEWTAATANNRWLLVGFSHTDVHRQGLPEELLVDRDSGAVIPLAEPLLDRSTARLLERSFWIDERTLGTLYIGGPLVVRRIDALDDPEIIPLP